MSEDSSSDGKALDLLNRLLHILESDPLIDEVGFIPQSQFITLEKEAGGSVVSSGGGLLQSQDGILSYEKSDCNVLEKEANDFWHRDHKLGISTEVLLPLYRVAKHAFFSALRKYKTLNSISDKGTDKSIPCGISSSFNALESEVMKHSRALLLLSCDFGTAWNSRKLVALKKQDFSVLMDELHLSALVLSYSPKSEHAWSHRRWVIKTIAGNISLPEIVGKESELVERIAERSKMNYRAWNHRCWLVHYMTQEQVLHAVNKSRDWAGFHVADNSAFHYHRRLMLRFVEDSCYEQEKDSSDHNMILYQVWKDELDWNEGLIRRFIGREALWLHRRFLSLYWIRHFATSLHGVNYQSEQKSSLGDGIGAFLNYELGFIKSCSVIPSYEFEDLKEQATHSASYLLWLLKQIPKSQVSELEEKLCEDLRTLLHKACPERSGLLDFLTDISEATDHCV